MNKGFKRGGLAMLGLAGAVAAAVVAGVQLGERKANRIISVQPGRQPPD